MPSILNHYRILKCPRGNPVYYPNTQLVVECTSAAGLQTSCPGLFDLLNKLPDQTLFSNFLGKSICVKATRDILNRFVCCFIPNAILIENVGNYLLTSYENYKMQYITGRRQFEIARIRV